MGAIYLQRLTALIYQFLAFTRGCNSVFSTQGHVTVASVAARVISHVS